MVLLLAMQLFNLPIGSDAAGKVIVVGALEKSPTIEQLWLLATVQSKYKIESADKVFVMLEKKRVPLTSLPVGTALRVEGKATAENKDNEKLPSIRIEKATILEGIQGSVESVMETFPLRLALKTETGNVMVQLDPNTRTFREKKLIENAELRSGWKVHALGLKDANLFVAYELRLIPEAKSRGDSSTPK